jgi:hypothetical protein
VDEGDWPVVIAAMRVPAALAVACTSDAVTICMLTTMGVFVATTSGVVALANERSSPPQATNNKEKTMSATTMVCFAGGRLGVNLMDLPSAVKVRPS